MSTDRVLLTLAVLAFAGGVYLLMLKGWRSRARRQADLPPPPRPTGDATTVVGAVPGLFVGTTYAGRWLDRVVVHDLGVRAAAYCSVATDGVHVEREGAPELFVPFDALEGAELGDALAGKVVGQDGLLLLHWRLGPAVVTSGFRADDRTSHPRLLDAIAKETVQ